MPKSFIAKATDFTAQIQDTLYPKLKVHKSAKFDFFC